MNKKRHVIVEAAYVTYTKTNSAIICPEKMSVRRSQFGRAGRESSVHVESKLLRISHGNLNTT